MGDLASEKYGGLFALRDGSVYLLVGAFKRSVDTKEMMYVGWNAVQCSMVEWSN